MSANPAVTAPAPASSSPAVGAAYGLFILTVINLINYLDRYIVAAVLPSIKQDLQVNNTQSGMLGSIFIIVFMVASPLGGYLGDRMARKYLVAGGVLLWSLATGASGLATTFLVLLVARSIVG